MADDNTPRYTVEIDEEGYPMFDGLRVQDDDWTRELLSGLYRAQRRGRTILARCEGEDCWVNAFDAPLVAIRAELVGTEVELRFPGAFVARAPLAAFEIDEWNRLHARVGTEEIPAVLSRAAQASLLMEVDASFAPSKFRSTSPSVGEAKFWGDAYREPKQGWERNGPQAKLVEKWPLLKRRLLDQPSPLTKLPLLVPAAGRAHDAVLFEKEGFAVHAVDFAEEAVRAFREVYPDSKIRYERADLFELFPSAPRASYRGAFDVAAFIAIDPARRQDYVDGLARVLAPGAYYYGFFHLLTESGGPPFGLTQWELNRYWTPYFEFVEWEWIPPGANGVEALWAVMRRRT